MNDKKLFLDYILSKLEPHGPIWARAMFGGYGIYYQTTMFALIAESILYFRIDEENRLDYSPYEAKPFIYSGGQKQITLPYLELPEEVLNDSEILAQWIEKSKDAAMRYKALHPKKARVERKRAKL